MFPSHINQKPFTLGALRETFPSSKTAPGWTPGSHLLIGSPESMLPRCAPKLAQGRCRIPPPHGPLSLQQIQRGGDTLGNWELREKKPDRKIKRKGIPLLLLLGRQKHPFPSTSWQVGACLTPVWTSSPKRNSDYQSSPVHA